MLHNTVVDTSVVFPHRLGPPFKIALRFLAADHLKRIIQSDGKLITHSIFLINLKLNGKSSDSLSLN